LDNHSYSFLSIGIDDIDTPGGGCTTHFGALLSSYLMKTHGIEFIDYPLLVRLNPAVPWKTRGNASVVIRVHPGGIDARELADEVENLVEEYLGECRFKETKPGIVVYRGDPWRAFSGFYYKALTDVVTMDMAEKLLERYGGLKRGGRGVIGALAGVGALGPGEPYSFELLAYRDPGFWGSERSVGFGSVYEYDVLTGELTFSNIDYQKRKTIITPHGPDPVLYGVRGTNPEALIKALEIIKTGEPVHGWCLFRSNQGTSVHERTTSIPRYYKTGTMECTVKEESEILPKGHVLVKAECGGVPLDVLFYRESFPLNKAAASLLPGDQIKVTGSIKQRQGKLTLNAEVLYITRLVWKRTMIAPRCPRCGARMKSKGSGKGYKCPRCGFYDRRIKSVEVIENRNLCPGRYVPVAAHIAHLVRPNWLRLPVLDGVPLELVEGWCKLPG